MAGFFKSMRWAGPISDAARYSEPFHSLGVNIKQWELGYSNNDSRETIQNRKFAATSLNQKKQALDYHLSGQPDFMLDTIKFFVAFSAVTFGYDGVPWVWQDVRNTTQGLWTSMEDDKDFFITKSKPFFDNILERNDTFLRDLSNR
jgi:hypothetical protein